LAPELFTFLLGLSEKQGNRHQLFFTKAVSFFLKQWFVVLTTNAAFNKNQKTNAHYQKHRVKVGLMLRGETAY
jgi:hypothetical protein